MSDDGDKPKVSCSFCGKGRDDTHSLIASQLPHPPAFICDECISVCVDVLMHQGAPLRWLYGARNQAEIRP
jgi:ATP-dependent protease Clp ATPase subunit